LTAATLTTCSKWLAGNVTSQTQSLLSEHGLDDAVSAGVTGLQVTAPYYHMHLSLNDIFLNALNGTSCSALESYRHIALFLSVLQHAHISHLPRRFSPA